MFTKQKSFIQLLCLLVILSILSACGSNDGKENKQGNSEQVEQTQQGKQNNTNQSDNGSKENEEKPAEPEQAVARALTDPLGNLVNVPANPQKIIATYLEDYLVALDVKPAAQWSVFETPMQYLQYALEGIPILPHDIPYEAVTKQEPDLIIIGDENLISGGKYETYNQIAPTYALGAEINADWRRALLEIGKVLDKEEQAQKVLDNYEAKAQKTKAELGANGEMPSATAIWLVNGTFWMVSKNESSGAVIYNDLGLQVPELVDKISREEGGIWKSVSMEGLAELDADHIFLINSDKASGSEALNDPVWKSITAVKNGNLHEFEKNSSWLYTGPIANDMIIDNIVESLLK